MIKPGPILLAAVLAWSASAGTAWAQQPGSAPAPGQSAQPLPPGAPQGLGIGEIRWYPVSSHCRFFTPAEQVAFEAGQPDSWKFIFITIMGDGTAGNPPLERGYVMANGLLRELEKGMTAPDRDGNVTIVWRSAGEPRIGVNLVLRKGPEAGGEIEYRGAMTLFWGDRKATAEIVGSCKA